MYQYDEIERRLVRTRVAPFQYQVRRNFESQASGFLEEVRQLDPVQALVQKKGQGPGTRAVILLVLRDPWFFTDNHAQIEFIISCKLCACARPVLPNQHEREGRCWWEDVAAKECGLDVENLM